MVDKNGRRQKRKDGLGYREKDKEIEKKIDLVVL